MCENSDYADWKMSTVEQWKFRAGLDITHQAHIPDCWKIWISCHMSAYKKISWFLDSSEQYYFVTPLQWWSMFRLKQQWTRLIYLLISWNSNLFQLCLISRVKTKIVSKKLSCDFRHNLTFEIKNSDKRCSLLPTRSMWEKMIRSTEFTLFIRIQN